MRRTARFLTFLLFLGAWLAFGYWAAFGRSGGIPDTQLKCPDCDAIEVTRIIDGDTFDSAIGRVHLFGMDTPERGEPCFDEATERLADLAAERSEQLGETGGRQRAERLGCRVVRRDGRGVARLRVLGRFGFGRRPRRRNGRRGAGRAGGLAGCARERAVERRRSRRGSRAWRGSCTGAERAR